MLVTVRLTLTPLWAVLPAFPSLDAGARSDTLRFLHLHPPSTSWKLEPLLTSSPWRQSWSWGPTTKGSFLSWQNSCDWGRRLPGPEETHTHLPQPLEHPTPIQGMTPRTSAGKSPKCLHLQDLWPRVPVSPPICHSMPLESRVFHPFPQVPAGLQPLRPFTSHSL